jgi:hypothetical protein
MEYGNSFVCVLGAGHLAAAVRVRLRSQALLVPATNCDVNSEGAALFLACSDFENTAQRQLLCERAREDRCAILFSCLQGDSVRVGPLFSSCSQLKSTAHYLTRSWDFSRSETRGALFGTHELLTHRADTRVTYLAQIGARFVVRELAKVWPAAQEGAQGRVAENDSPTNLSGWDWEWAAEDWAEGRLAAGGGEGSVGLRDGRLVGGERSWREVCRLPLSVWHPGLIG